MSGPASEKGNVIDLLRERGFVQQVTEEMALRAHLGAGRVTYYVGFDPTAPSLHIGSLVPLMAIAHLARAGHRPVAVLGGGTAMVGDPSGRSELRQVMSVEQIQANRQKIELQVRRFLDPSGDSVVADNADWLAPLHYLEFLRDIGRHFSVNRMLAAEAYKVRLEKGLSFIEFNYQLLQAYDFLVLFRRYGCTLQMGGDDQWGNMLAGTDLIRRLHQAETYALTFPLITTASGAKMGKTAAGAIWLSATSTSPFDFFQYFVNVDDRDVGRFLRLFTFLPLSEIAPLEALQGAQVREAKHVLAYEVTKVVHGAVAADEARAGARAAFGGSGGTGDLIPTHEVSAAELKTGLKIVDLLVSCGLASSKSAARRLVEQGGIKVAERKIASIDETLPAEEVGTDGVLLHAGRKHVRRIVSG